MELLFKRDIKLVILVVSVFLGVGSAIIGTKIKGEYLIYTLFLALILSVIILGIIKSMKTHGYLDILSPYVFFPMMYLVIYGVGPHKALGISEEIGALALQIIGGGFLAFLLGALLMSAILLKKSNETKVIIKEVTPDFEKRLSRISKIAFLIGTVAMLMFYVNARGIPILMSDLENSRVTALSGNGISYYLSMLIMISVWVYFLKEKKTSSKLLFLGIGMAFLLSTGWRNTAVALLLVCVLMYHYQRPIPFRKLAITGITIVIVIAVTGLFRIYSSDLQTYELMQMMMKGNYVQAFFAYLYNYPVVFTDNLLLVLNGFSDPNMYLHGRSFFWNFGLIIPGVNLEAFDFYLKDYLRVGFAGGGLPPTLLGDFYLNFGYTGVYIGMVMMGLLWTYLHYIFMMNKRNITGLTALIILYYLSVSIRGGIENITLITTWLLLSLYGLLFFSRINSFR
ncbi:O-antigen polymerase [Niallia circulans]|uniref:Oligosaccharide repeat unit polymerase n=1 Tax=Niallia circulans TaxID=1397 RepID=A0A941JS82_NIACI|nr:O-antigen polymerase [Niallia circulans]MCB5237678.1 oligosaccharide repeat unit polymerase [Niallia circulans]